MRKNSLYGKRKTWTLIRRLDEAIRDWEVIWALERVKEILTEKAEGTRVFMHNQTRLLS